MSYIKQKMCKCGCGKYPTLGFKGYNINCAPQDIKDKVFKKRMASQNKTKERAVKRYWESKKDEAQDKWYTERRKEMTGKCINCGSSTHPDNEKYWKWSIAHILPKSLFPSIAKDKDNWMELCIDCHTKYDSNWMTASGMKVWSCAIKKMNSFVSKLTKEELRRLPEEVEY